MKKPQNLAAPVSTRLALAAAICLASFAGTVSLAHPYHTTTAEVTHNRESGTLEVAMRVIPEDLERALRRASGKKVRLEIDSETDQLVADYLEKRFLLRQGDQALPLRWVGKEVSTKAAWLYFEIPLEHGSEDLELEHRVFFELEKEQLNVVEVRDGESRFTLSFHREHPVQPLFQPPDP